MRNNNIPIIPLCRIYNTSNRKLIYYHNGYIYVDYKSYWDNKFSTYKTKFNINIDYTDLHNYNMCSPYNSPMNNESFYYELPTFTNYSNSNNVNDYIIKIIVNKTRIDKCKNLL